MFVRRGMYVGLGVRMGKLVGTYGDMLLWLGYVWLDMDDDDTGVVP